MEAPLKQRSHWGSRIGFILAAAGSAVGLGNIWKFPYVTGENGGGIFVLVYLACVLLVGLPIMIAEILIGRTTQSSPVGAFKSLAGTRSPWVGMGWLGVVSAFILLSFYSVVAGWSLHYTWLSISGQLAGLGPENMAPVFGNLNRSVEANLFWHLIFMGLTIAVVFGGVSKGVERWSRILMPALLIMMLVLLGNSLTLDGFGKAVQFLFGFHQDKFTAAGALEALGHAFFSLSLGMGAMLTYGSYLRRRDDIVGASVTISALDTSIALVASLMLFPIIFSYGMEPAAGPGLVFISVPIALSQMPGTTFLATVFFALLVFAALTSAISMLEVATSYLIDQRGWQRRRAAVAAGLTTALVGLPSALSGGTRLFGSGMEALVGRNWFDSLDYLVTNWMLPLGGLGMALFTAWRMNQRLRREEFLLGSRLRGFYQSWLFLLKYPVPVAILLIFLNAVGLV
jgi:NSS family neurotransmitter:Na+ symporter